MTTINITRPSCTENFTTLPNPLFDFNRHFDNLKPRDSAVLNYLFSKPATWKLRVQDIANAINVCVRTVYNALHKLQLLGIARYERKIGGFTEWFVALPESAAMPGNAPHGKKSREILSRGKIDRVLTNTEKSLENNETALTKKEKTTDDIEGNGVKNLPPEIAEMPVVAVEAIHYSEIEIDIAEFNPQQKIIAQKSLEKVPSASQQIILMMLKVALSKGGVNSPLAYLNALINKAIAGELDISRTAELQKQTAKPIPRIEKIRRLFEKHGAEIQTELNEKGFIFLKGEGSIYKLEFEALGLMKKPGHFRA